MKTDATLLLPLLVSAASALPAISIAPNATCDPFSTCTTPESCLQIVDAYLAKVPRSSYKGLLATNIAFDDEPCPSRMNAVPEYSECYRHDLYDNSLAAIYFLKRGNVGEATRVLGALESFYVGSAHNGLAQSSDGLWLKCNASLSRCPPEGGWNAGADASYDTADNAWAGIAFATGFSTTGNAKWQARAKAILAGIELQRCDDAWRGFKKGVGPGVRSVENNVDIYALATLLGDAGAAAAARTFVEAMYGRAYANASAYSMAYAAGDTGSPAGACAMEVNDASAVPVDGAAWTALARADGHTERYAPAVAWASSAHIGTLPGLRVSEAFDGVEYHGIRFSSSGSNIQFEATSFVLMSVVAYGGPALARLTEALRCSLRTLLHKYGMVPAAVADGGAYPRPTGGAASGYGYSYYRHGHLASNMWAAFALMQQFTTGGAIDEGANPFTAKKLRDRTFSAP